MKISNIIDNKMQKRKKTLTTKNTHVHTQKSKNSYVISKAKMIDEMYKSIHNESYIFNISTQLDKRTFELFKNLNPSYKWIYMYMLAKFLNEKNCLSHTEKLVWTSEFLDMLNNKHDEFEPEFSAMYQLLIKQNIIDQTFGNTNIIDDDILKEIRIITNTNKCNL